MHNSDIKKSKQPETAELELLRAHLLMHFRTAICFLAKNESINKQLSIKNAHKTLKTTFDIYVTSQPKSKRTF
jgi:hypothetical protein